MRTRSRVAGGLSWAEAVVVPHRDSGAIRKASTIIIEASFLFQFITFINKYILFSQINRFT